MINDKQSQFLLLAKMNHMLAQQLSHSYIHAAEQETRGLDALLLFDILQIIHNAYPPPFRSSYRIFTFRG